ncbi:hypothetical protein DRQ18_01590 [bacterium]|nr:MAG: hypothetical protein DRQ18_01590 [bacterium]
MEVLLKVREIVGPTLVIFIFYFLMELIILVRYPWARKKNLPDKTYLENFFRMITGTSVLVGALGTFLGIVVAFQHIGESETLKNMLDNLFRGTQQAMWSSVVGITLAIFNYLLDTFTGWNILIGERREYEGDKN